MYASTTVDCDGSLDIVTPYGDLLAAIKHARKSECVELESTGQQLCVRTAGSETMLGTFEIGNFPEEPELDDPTQCLVTLTAADVKALANHTRNDNYRPTLDCILVDQQEDRITLVSTDSHRMLVHTGYGSSGTPLQILVPAKHFEALAPAGQTYHSITLESGSNGKARARTSNTTITYETVAGTFPNWQRIVPEDDANDIVLTFNRDDLEKAILAVKSTAKNGANRVIFSAKESTLELTAQDDDGRTSKATVTLNNSADLPIRFAANFQFVIDAIHSMHGPVTLRLATPARPLRFKQEDNKGPLAIVMPMALPENDSE